MRPSASGTAAAIHTMYWGERILSEGDEADDGCRPAAHYRESGTCWIRWNPHHYTAR
jgi:hypothetical protein